MGAKVLIAGADGYLGWALSHYLVDRGYQVVGIDNGARRRWVKEVGSHSATPIADPRFRERALRAWYGQAAFKSYRLDLTNYPPLETLLLHEQPDAIVHLAECPSAPYSMRDVWSSVGVQQNNVVGTLNLLWAMRDVCPAAHLVKLGSMGEYGTPEIPIPEGPVTVTNRGMSTELPMPRSPGSWYHLSKVHDTHNLRFACSTWGLRATDIMQGVVFGLRWEDWSGEPPLLTRFDFDECFGTAINRFCAQAVIEHPITVYGAGGQTRGFLPLADSMQCLELAIQHPPERGEYRELNQFENAYKIVELAGLVARVARDEGLTDREPGEQIVRYENPRDEAEEHFYEPERVLLDEMGYEPTVDVEGAVAKLLQGLVPYRDRIEAKRDVIEPATEWDPYRRPAEAWSRTATVSKRSG